MPFLVNGGLHFIVIDLRDVDVTSKSVGGSESN